MARSELTEPGGDAGRRGVPDAEQGGRRERARGRHRRAVRPLRPRGRAVAAALRAPLRCPVLRRERRVAVPEGGALRRRGPDLRDHGRDGLGARLRVGVALQPVGVRRVAPGRPRRASALDERVDTPED